MNDEATGYFLQSERLGFRCWSGADTELAWGLWGDPEVTRLIGGPFSRPQVEEKLRLEIERLAAHGVQYWPVFLRSSGEHVGCCGLRPYAPEEAILELGFHLKSASQGHGYAMEAARAVMGHAFGALGARGLFAGHHPENAASRRLLSKLGFSYVRDEHYAPTGLMHPSYLCVAAKGP
jgi:RimJ/RimL family protein N-acetyltransferase